jgi:protein arginine kinase activator
MLCQICQKNVANVHFTQIVNSKKIELYLCEQCAKEKGQLNIGSPFGMADFFAGLMGFGENAAAHNQAQLEQHCKTCGMSYEDFQKTGKLGCGDCYKLFGDKMKPVLKRLHGNLGHTGKMPSRFNVKADETKASDLKAAETKKTAVRTYTADETGAPNGAASKETSETLELEHLREMLNKCIKSEEYEKAAELRDRIREIESRRQG